MLKTLDNMKDISDLLKSDITHKDIDNIQSSLSAITNQANQPIKFDRLIYGTTVKGYPDDKSGDIEIVIIRPQLNMDIKLVPILSTHEVVAILEHTQNILKNVSSMKHVEKELIHLKQHSLDACRIAMNSLMHEDIDTQQKVGVKINVIRRMLKFRISKSIKLLAVIPRLNSEAMNHSQEYCRTSLATIH